MRAVATWFDELAEHHERSARRVQEGLARLSAEDRALVHLYYFEEQSLAEIAAILGVARETLKMRLARARQRLRDLLQDPDERQ